jgi:Ca2+/H+ antiporter, TMEM165/GDT1 family
MVLADGLAIAMGAVLHKRLPEHFLHGMASALFLLFGLWLLFDGGLGLRCGLRWESPLRLPWQRQPRNRREHPQALPPLESSPDPGGPPAGYCPSND